jgi:hypothetical protein
MKSEDKDIISNIIIFDIQRILQVISWVISSQDIKIFRISAQHWSQLTCYFKRC